MKAEGSWPYPYCWYGFWFSVFDSWSVPSVSCEGEAEYAPAETVGFRLRFKKGLNKPASITYSTLEQSTD